MKKLFLLFIFTVFAFGATQISDKEFDSKISKGNVIVEFYSKSWSACKILGENIKQYEPSIAKDVKFYQINLYTSPNATQKIGVFAIPALVYFKNGKQVGIEYGVKSTEGLKSLEDKYFRK